MLGPTHSLIALTGAVVIASTAHASYTEAGILIGGAVTTAKLPDVDMDIVQARKRLVVIALLAALVAALVVLASPWIAAATAAAIWVLYQIEHRGPVSHSLLGAGVVVAAATLAALSVAPHFALLVGAGVALGVVLHQLADGLTISGVPLLYPFVRSDVHLLPAGFRIRTGASVEAVFSFVLLAGLLGFVWMTYGR